MSFLKKSAGVILTVCFLSNLSFADEIISGHYCYTFGDRESLKEAREITRTLAIRNAIESYKIYIESTTKLSNFTLTNDIVQMLSVGYLKNVNVDKHEEQGRTICDTIRATVKPSDIETFTKREVARRTLEIEDSPINSNDCLKILSTGIGYLDGDKEKEYPLIYVVLKALKDSSICGIQKVYIDYIDANGDAYDGGNRMVENFDKGEIMRINFHNKILSKNGTFRVWFRK